MTQIYPMKKKNHELIGSVKASATNIANHPFSMRNSEHLLVTKFNTFPTMWDSIKIV